MTRQSIAVGLAVSVAAHLAVAAALWPASPAFRHTPANSGDPGGAGITSGLELTTPVGRDERLSTIRLDVVEHVISSNAWPAGALLNHLWQSTIFTLVVASATLAFRRHAASIRYWLWFSASVKFLVPFSLLLLVGTWLPLASPAPQPPAPDWSLTLAQVSQPFADGSSAVAAPLTDGADRGSWAGLALVSIWACGSVAVLLFRSAMWRRIQDAVRHSAPIRLEHVTVSPDVPLRGTHACLEPAVVGFWRPIVLLPIGIDRHLTAAQLEAVLAHELCHVRRRDNLTAAVHMAVEAAFWFHPLVWWIGARLVDERERACDEAVLRTTGDPRAYADAIVSVCRRYVTARLAHVAGVSGSDLRRRIEAIMRRQVGQPLDAWKAVLLATVAIAVVTMPVAVGALTAPRPQAQPTTAGEPAFEVAAIRPNTSGDLRMALLPQPGGRLTATNVTARSLIHFAYDLPTFQVSGGPDWISSDRFDVLAKAEGDPPVGQKRLMLRRLLAERFGLVVHTETRQLPVYRLMLAREDRRLGPQLRPSAADCAGIERTSDGVGPAAPDGPPSCSYFGFSPGTKVSAGRGGLGIRGMTMAGFARSFAPMVGRTVIDRTDLAGYFDADFDFVAELPPPPPPPGVANPFSDRFLSLFTVLPEQLGLNLESGTGPVAVLVIDQATRPMPD